MTYLESKPNPLCYQAISFWTNTERLRGHPFCSSQFSVALQRAVLQAATWSVWNASATTRNQVVEMRNGLGKSLVLSPAVDLIDAICEQR